MQFYSKQKKTVLFQELLKKRYEIIVTLEGIVEPSGMSIQARSSYMPDGILWGYRFVNVLRYNDSSGQVTIKLLDL